MNKKISLGLAISLIAIACAVTFILTSFFSLQEYNKKAGDVNEKSKKYTALQHLDSYVRENYYGDINEDSVNSGILKGYISGIGDKYSQYLTADEYAEEQNNNEGSLVGLGLTLAEDESGYIIIKDILPGSPVLEMNVAAGDIITAVNGEDVLSIGFDDSITAMKGQEGEQITLNIRRDGVEKQFTFTRKAIEVTTVTGEMKSNFIGYIRIAGFKKNTPQQFIDTLEKLTANGAKGIIFDLRGNPGGLVSSLEECLDPLLPEGVIVTAEYKDGHSETVVYSDESELNIPMTVIVDKDTASSAELFAASLHDFEKAQLIGEKTYGKGVMQTTSAFDNGGAVTLTVAVLRTAKSETYNNIGLTPDHPIEDDPDTEDDEQYNKALEVLISEMN